MSRSGRTIAALALSVLIAGLATTTWLSCASSKSGKATDDRANQQTVGAPPSSQNNSDAGQTSDNTAGESDGTKSGREGTLWYRLEFADDGLAIRLRLLAPPSECTLFFPRARNNPEKRTGARDIELESVRGPDGALDHTFIPSDGKIDVSAGEVDWLEVAYRLPTPEPINGVHWIDPAASLLVPSQTVSDPIEQIPVELYVPTGWQSTSTWATRASRPAKSVENRRLIGYVADDLASLRDAFLAAGPELRHIRSEDGDRAVTTAYDSSLTEQSAASLHRRTVDLVSAYRETFGEVGAVNAFLRTGRPFEGYHIGSGRRGGFILEVPPEAPTGNRATILLAHEALHVWNGHHVVPADEAELDWFIEGITHYLAVTLATRRGLLSEEEGRRELSRSLRHYQSNPMTGDTDSTATTPIQRQRFPYDRGVVFGLAVDARIRGEHARTVWMEVLRRLVRRANETDTADLRADTLEQVLLAVSRERAPDSDIQSLWQRVVNPEETLPVRKIAKQSGISHGEDTGSDTAMSGGWPFDRTN